ncbi:ROK family protein [Paenibacillus filicis]|uniref:ROK family protein n=1 Tax=Paenibacillus gyeongsangnamensis TaxID=3388067 RepID=A0ABT4Q233_9BACL|nr:ROK family protein [Paenibacillus filicis]MCZ8510942.1 ROK family protein [Paenibacillus filicis]
MNRAIILAFDVGGTQIKAAAVIGGSIIEETISQYESHADRSAEQIIAHFMEIAVDIVGKAGREQLPIGGLGMAFPGPFDYENGISLIQGLSKFESLYGLSVGKQLEEAIRSNENLGARLDPSFGIRFENDAALFGLGEAGYGEARGSERTVCLTIGTGLGSCFLENGRLVKHRDGVPEQGWLYNIPYGDKLADDYVSRRGILRLAEELGLELEGPDVHDCAMLAKSGDQTSKRLFEEFGRRMAAILAPSLRVFAPDTIVIGGQISKSSSLFLPAFCEELTCMDFQTNIRVSRNTLFSTFNGIYDFMDFC